MAFQVHLPESSRSRASLSAASSMTPYRFAVSPSPAPATSNGANGFPVRRFPVRFASRVM